MRSVTKLNETATLGFYLPRPHLADPYVAYNRCLQRRLLPESQPTAVQSTVSTVLTLSIPSAISCIVPRVLHKPFDTGRLHGDTSRRFLRGPLLRYETPNLPGSPDQPAGHSPAASLV